MEQVPPDETGILARCRALASRDGLGMADLVGAVAGGDPSEVLGLARPEPRRPYGRTVLMQSASLEAMVASWTPSFPCAPHDHGGSEGVVRVLQGKVLHRMWRVEGGRLTLAAEEQKQEGDLLTCGPHLVHSMVDAGGALPLITLHLYHRPITHMVVYDRAAQRTLVVHGGCGAWVPVDEPSLVLADLRGFVPPEVAEAAC